MTSLHRRRAAALALPLVLAALLLPRPAAAAIALKSGDWEVSFDGFVNTFAVYQKGSDVPTGVAADGLLSVDDSFRIRTGLLPGLFGFGVTAPKTDGLDMKARIGIYPQTNNAGGRTAFGSQMDLREAFFTVDGSFGQVLVGRALNLYQGKNILNDMTLFGAGVQGGVSSGGTTLGRIGYGYLYAQFGAQLRYTTPSLSGLTLAISAADPSKICGAGAPACFTVTKSPAMEAEVAFAQTMSGAAVRAWASGLWQDASTPKAPGVATKTVTATGGAFGVGVGVAGLDVLASGFAGKGLGSFLLLDIDSLDANGKEISSMGLLGQVTYAFGATKVGASYGQNSMTETTAQKDARNGGGAPTIDTRSSVTAGVYHDLNKSLKVVAEYTHATTKWFGGKDQSNDVMALGGFLFW